MTLRKNAKAPALSDLGLSPSLAQAASLLFLQLPKHNPISGTDMLCLSANTIPRRHGAGLLPSLFSDLHDSVSAVLETLFFFF